MLISSSASPVRCASAQPLHVPSLDPGAGSREFFGFYLLGKFAAVFGPLLMGYVGLLTGSPRKAILSLIVLFIAGAVAAHAREAR